MFWKMIRWFLFLLVFSSFSLQAKETVTVSIQPQMYFVKRVSGDFLNVNVMVPPGSNPSVYEPKPRQMVELNQSSIYFAIGAPYERTWLSKIQAANPSMKLVKTQEGIQLRPMEVYQNHDHGEGKDLHGHDSEGIPDPHIWLSPRLVYQQVQNILQALIEQYPEQKKRFEKNAELFLQDIEQLDQQIKSIIGDVQGKKFMVFHPSWGYFAQDYHLEQIPVEVEGKEPGPRALMELIDAAVQENIQVVFVAPQFSRKAAEIIARNINGSTLVADPLSENWLENMKKVAQSFQQAMR